jgi:hypothetical protein
MKIRPHTAHQVEEETIAYLVRQRIARFGHRMVLHTPPKWRRHHQLAGTFGRCATRFLNKKLERQREKCQNAPMNLLITQNTRMKISKYPQRKSLFFFVFFKVKNVHSLYMDYEKTVNTPAQQLNKFFISGPMKYFYY